MTLNKDGVKAGEQLSQDDLIKLLAKYRNKQTVKEEKPKPKVKPKVSKED